MVWPHLGKGRRFTRGKSKCFGCTLRACRQWKSPNGSAHVEAVREDLELMQREWETAGKMVASDFHQDPAAEEDHGACPSYLSALSEDPSERRGVVGDCVALLGAKMKAASFLLKLQEARRKEERSASREAVSRQRSAPGSGGAARVELVDSQRSAFVGSEEPVIAENPIGVDQARVEEESANPAAAYPPHGGVRAGDVAEKLECVDQNPGTPAKAGTPTSHAVAEKSEAVHQTGPAKAGTPASRGTVPAKAGTPTLHAVAGESEGGSQNGPAKAGTPTSHAVAEKSEAVYQTGPAKAGTPASRGTVPAKAGTPTLHAVAEKSEAVYQTGPAKAGTPASRGTVPAKAGTPTSHAVAEKSEAVYQTGPAKAGTPASRGTVPAKAGTPTSHAVAGEPEGGSQNGPARAGSPTSLAVAEEPESVDQDGAGQVGAEAMRFGAFRNLKPDRTKIVWA